MNTIKQTKSLLEIDEIKHLQQVLDNWQMVPLSFSINNCSPLLIKYNYDESYELFKNNPTIETIPFFIEIDNNSSIVKICYLFIKVYSENNDGYSIHEVIFNLQDTQQINDCKNILGSKNNCVVLISTKDISFIGFDLAEQSIIGNNYYIEKLVNHEDPAGDYQHAVSLIQQYKEDAESLLQYFNEISRKQHSSMFSINTNSLL